MNANRTGRRLFALVALYASAASSRPATAQQATQLPIEAVLSMRTPAGVMSFSPDGEWLAYVVEGRRSAPVLPGLPRQEAMQELTPTSDIYVTNTRTHETQILTAGHAKSWLPKWSPDGSRLAFLSRPEPGDAPGLWLWSLKGGTMRPLSDMHIAGDQFEWTPDGQGILVTVTPSASSEAKDETKPDCSAPCGKGSPREVPGSTVTVFTSGSGDLDRRSLSTPWSLDPQRRDLAIIDIGTSAVRIVTRGQRITRFHLLGSGDRAAFSSPVSFERASSQQVLYDLSVISVTGGKMRTLASHVRLHLGGEFTISPDGAFLAYRADGDEERTRDVFLVPVDGEPPRNVTHFIKEESQDSAAVRHLWPYSRLPLWDRNGERVYLLSRGSLWVSDLRDGKTTILAQVPHREIRQLIAKPDGTLWTSEDGATTVLITTDSQGKQDGFYTLDLRSGTSAKIEERGACYVCLGGFESSTTAASHASLVAYVAQDAQHAPDIWVMDPQASTLVPLTDLNPQLRNYKMGSMRIIDWLGDDGNLLDGALLLPSDYVTGKRYPMIVFAYGGVALSQDADRFGGFDWSAPYFNIQLLATRGYAVLMPDAPQHLGTPMLDLAKTILPGVNKAVELGIADPERLGLLGHSYGGYTALSLLAQTNRFRAGVEANGPGDLNGHYGQLSADGTAFGAALAETGQELMGGTPWEFPDRYRQNSPVTFLDHIETPLLIVQGEEDTGVAPFLGDELFVGLRRLGRVVEYARYRGERHWNLGYANQLDAAYRVIGWFDKYLSATSCCPQTDADSTQGQGAGAEP